MGAKARARFVLSSSDGGRLAPGWEQSLAHPALSAAGRSTRKLESISDQEIARLSSTAVSLPLRMWLSPFVSAVEGVQAEHLDAFLGLALDPVAWAHLRGLCGEGLLCVDERAAAVQLAVEEGLASAMGHSFDVPARFREAEEDLALLAAEVVAGMGPRGAEIARGVLEGDSTTSARVLAVYVLARTLPRESAIASLLDLVGSPGALSVAASLELAGLGASDLVPIHSPGESGAAALLVRFAASGLESSP